jgi:hypothetical protein
MRGMKTLPQSSFFFGTLMILTLFSAAPTRAEAQCPAPTAGFNAVYGNCNGVSKQGTFAMVDASQYTSNTIDICRAIQQILTAYQHGNSNGVVVDARGVKLAQTPACSTNPWGISPEPDNSVVLLPAGTITIPSKWILPANSRLVGQGSNVTVLQAGSALTGEMIDMGNATLCPASSNNDCPGVQVEHLTLIGNGVSGLGGILNQFSQELSYVNDVSFTNFLGTELTVATQNAVNSGPYSNLTMSNVGTCVNINSTYGTRGIHGLTCTLRTSSTAGVLVDGSNNNIEDVFIQGGTSQNGILVGSQLPARSNLLFNVTGSGLRNVIELSTNASDVTILGATNTGSNVTIKDDLTVPNPSLTDAKLGIYVLGEPVQGNASGTPVIIGYSRFTTSMSSSAVTWLVGPSSPSGTCPAGDLFSQTSDTGSGTTLWGCGFLNGSPGTGQWYAIK